MGGHLLMSEKERLRKVVLEGVRAGRLTVKAASDRLGVSYRQARRIWQRFRALGDPGLIHQGRGRPSNRAKPAPLREKAIVRYRERYTDFGPTLACEKLAEEDLVLNHETLRRWLIAERLWAGSPLKVRHRSYRERRARFGELVQLDGSLHRWFGKDFPEACLLNLVDDATGRTLSWMTEHESTEGGMRILKRWIERFGVLLALYTDKHTIYLSPREPTLVAIRHQLFDASPPDISLAPLLRRFIHSNALWMTLMVPARPLPSAECSGFSFVPTAGSPEQAGPPHFDRKRSGFPSAARKLEDHWPGRGVSGKVGDP
jgi:transposase